MQSFDEGEDVFLDAHFSTPSEEFVAENSELELGRFSYEFWESELTSVRDRRDRFLRRMGFEESVLSPSGCYQEPRESGCNGSDQNSDLERVRESSGALLDPLSSPDSRGFRDSFCCIRDLDSGKKFFVHELGQDGLPSMLTEVGSDRVMTLQEFEKLLGLSGSVQQFMRRERTLSVESQDGCRDTRKKKFRSWWKNFKMRRQAMGMFKQDVTTKNFKLPGTVRTKVWQHGKRCMEVSALYLAQDIQAHKGLIRTMKFSSSGRYLASGGEDCVVRIWRIREVEASCRCLTANGYSKFADKVKDRKSNTGFKRYHSAPVVIPKKVFKIEETALHEYRGHSGDVLDLSWSKSDFLLTSSKDRTVRMWKVGCDGCLKVFQHNDYVTCIQFNPVDESYFISGSIDGKVRIWGVLENRVVDWVDVRDIVTVVCYQPDGKGFVVGSIAGNCRFYCQSANAMQLESQFHVQGKKKSTGKPITGLQFSLDDAERIMITSADSKIRIYEGVRVTHTFRGTRKSKWQLSASFTKDGKYIISVDEDSHVYIWNNNKPSNHSSKGAKSTRSYEHFFSQGVSVAVPWPGLECKGPGLSDKSLHVSSPRKFLEPLTWLRDPDCFPIGVWYFADGLSRLSATWPEEKLPASAEPAPQVDTSPCHDYHQFQFHHQYECLSSLSATWSLVIVTASRDGCIRSFHNYGLPVRL